MSELVWLAAQALASGRMKTPDPALEPQPPSLEAVKVKAEAATVKRPIAAVEVSQPEFSQSDRTKLPEPAGIPMPASAGVHSGTAPVSRTTASLPRMRRSPLSTHAPTAYLPEAALQTPRPASGSQLYQQRVVALRAGRTYTRLPANSFYRDWINASHQPTYEEWVNLLNLEGRAMARGQGANRLSVLLGDSLSLWYPSERLTSDRFWLNQSISGDTTAGVLRRLSAFAQTRPDTIHLMVGINDLRRGASDAEVLNNLRLIVRQLRQTHPQARILVYSILPTRLPTIPASRIQGINQGLWEIARQSGATYMDLQAYFSSDDGSLRPDLTTDGLHLNPNGYAVWQWALQAARG